MPIKAYLVMLLLYLWCFPYLAGAQENWNEGAFNTISGEQLSMEQWMAVLPEEFDLFKSEEALELVLESDFKQFIRNKDKDEFQEALLHFPLNDSIAVKRVVRIKPRGEFRKRFCSVPPIQLNFKKTEVYVNSIQQLEKMKVVAECKTLAAYEEFVLREYLAYKLYQLFSDISFKVRLLHLTTIDTGSKNRKTNTSYAFLIEEADDLAKRKDLQNLKVETAATKDIIEDNMALVALFEYMIGNSDWSIAGPHNFKLMMDKNLHPGKAYAVPYDFDHSGLVNAPYAAPPENFDIPNVRTRLLRCPCYSESIFLNTLELFISKKPQVMQTIEGFSYLSESAKKDITNFIGEFYQQIEREDASSFFLENCGQKL